MRGSDINRSLAIRLSVRAGTKARTMLNAYISEFVELLDSMASTAATETETNSD
jgi:hypothetical protein